jgi:hypothetical protein
MEHRALYGATLRSQDRPFVKRLRTAWRLRFEGCHLADNCAALVAKNSAKEHVNQQIKSENAKRHEYCERHGSLNRTGSESRRCFTEDRGEGAEKSGAFHQEFVREISFRKGIAFYTLLTKRAGLAQGVFPTVSVCC